MFGPPGLGVRLPGRPSSEHAPCHRRGLLLAVPQARGQRPAPSGRPNFPAASRFDRMGSSAVRDVSDLSEKPSETPQKQGKSWKWGRSKRGASGRRKSRPGKNFGDVAQLGERLVCNQEVAGSIPVVSTEALKGLTASVRFSPASIALKCCTETPAFPTDGPPEEAEPRAVLAIILQLLVRPHRRPQRALRDARLGVQRCVIEDCHAGRLASRPGRGRYRDKRFSVPLAQEALSPPAD
jgi:hypothetical protein